MYLGPQDSDTKKSRHESTYNIYDETLNIQLEMVRIRVILHVTSTNVSPWTHHTFSHLSSSVSQQIRSLSVQYLNTESLLLREFQYR